MKLQSAIEKAEGYLALRMGVMAWETLEDLPTEAKNFPRVLELRLECLVDLCAWEKAEILGESLAQILSGSALVWLGLARAKAQLKKYPEARAAMQRVSELAPERRMHLLDDELLKEAL